MPTPEPPEQVFAGGLMSTDAHDPNEPTPIGHASGGLVVMGEGNDDAASVFEDGGGWAFVPDTKNDDNKEK